MNVTCPSCHFENAYLEIVDASGAHYTCPDCDFEWSDDDYTIEEEESIDQFQNCPNCSKKGHSFVYQCNVCQFMGCYDEHKGIGCFKNEKQKVKCPKCSNCDYEIVGKIGLGWFESDE